MYVYLSKNSMYSFQIKFLEEKKRAGNMGNLFAKCIQRIFDDIIGSHAYSISRNGFEKKN